MWRLPDWMCPFSSVVMDKSCQRSQYLTHAGTGDKFRQDNPFPAIVAGSGKINEILPILFTGTDKGFLARFLGKFQVFRTSKCRKFSTSLVVEERAYIEECQWHSTLRAFMFIYENVSLAGRFHGRNHRGHWAFPE